MSIRRVALVLLFVSVAAHAQPARVFVSSAGVDTNSCSRTAPCRNFNAAVAAVANGGEVIVLDSAGYGPVTIGKNVSILAPQGVYAGITATSGSAIVVDGQSIRVTLRGLALTGRGAYCGVEVQSATLVRVESCTMTGFIWDGVRFATAGHLFVHDTASRENNNGIRVQPVTNSATAVVDHCRLESNDYYGLTVGGYGTAKVDMRDTVLANNAVAGVHIVASELNVKNCAVVHNEDGIYVSTTASVTISDTLIADNTQYCLSINQGSLYSYGNNEIAFNGHGNLSYGTVTPVTTR